MEDMARSTPALAGVLSGALAIADIEASRTDDAHRRLQEFCDRGCDLEMNPVWVTGMSFHAEAAIELGDAALCGPLYEQLRPWSDQWTDNGATAACPVSHYLGGFTAVLGRDDEAEAWFKQSLRMCDEVGAKFFRAQTELLWGRMLCKRDMPRARDLLEHARDEAVARGYGSVRQRAEVALARA
jgi:hypothetical protein